VDDKKAVTEEGQLAGGPGPKLQRRPGGDRDRTERAGSQREGGDPSAWQPDSPEGEEAEDEAAAKGGHKNGHDRPARAYVNQSRPTKK
jgi:hypothetical protein